MVLEAASFADALEIANSLKAERCVLLSLRRTDKDLTRRIVDFLSGIAYAVGGHSQKVADQVFLFTPGDIEIVMSRGTEAPRADGFLANPE